MHFYSQRSHVECRFGVKKTEIKKHFILISYFLRKEFLNHFACPAGTRLMGRESP